MSTRALTGVIYHQNNLPWEGCSVIVRLMEQFTVDGQVVPADVVNLLTNASGQIATTLVVPASGTAHYRIAYAGYTLDAYLEAGGAVTLAELVAAGGSAVLPNELVTLLSTHDADTGAHGQGGAAVRNATLVEWTTAESFEVLTASFDGDNVLDSATVRWPDGSAGIFTTVTKNSTHHLVDAYTVSHTVSGKTVTQALVTRNAAGAITAKPQLTVA